MNSGATAERVYDALKRQILTRAFRPGDRLDPATLAESLSSSATPVRDALHLLTGEGLVETRTSEGFHLPKITEPDLQDLYDWNGQVSLLALRHWTAHETSSTPVIVDTITDVAERAAALFHHLVGRSANAEHRRAVASLNDRLYSARLVEAHVLPGGDEELRTVAAAILEGALPEIRKLIGAYHRRRRRAAAEIVRAIYRDD